MLQNTWLLAEKGTHILQFTYYNYLYFPNDAKRLSLIHSSFKYDILCSSNSLCWFVNICRWRRSFFISLIFGLPVMVIMIYHMVEQKIHGKRPVMLVMPGLSIENLLYFILCTPVQVWSKLTVASPKFVETGVAFISSGIMGRNLGTNERVSSPNFSRNIIVNHFGTSLTLNSERRIVHSVVDT